jgi:hypothetical protein
MHITRQRELPSGCLGNWSATTSLAATAPLRVLLADDCPINQFLGAALLSTWGITPQIASNGVEALELVIEGEFDVVLMDLEMPVMNGLNATRSSAPTGPVAGCPSSPTRRPIGHAAPASWATVDSVPSCPSPAASMNCGHACAAGARTDSIRRP